MSDRDIYTNFAIYTFQVYNTSPYETFILEMYVTNLH